MASAHYEGLQQQQQAITHLFLQQQAANAEKEKKIEAARLKLKKFKKESRNSNSNQEANLDMPNGSNEVSGRSTPSSIYSHASNNHASKHSSMPKTTTSADNASHVKTSPMHYSSLNDSPNSTHQSDYLKEQLQLHVQTIGILVAEKTELHSKLQQTLKKCDKSQDENDELLGRLKTSRLKIAELERLLNHSQSESNAPGGYESSVEHMQLIERLRSELSSTHALNEELRMRLNESNENYAQKQREAEQHQQATSELQSQMEMLNLKLTQFSQGNELMEEPKVIYKQEDSQQLSELTAKIADLEVKLSGAEAHREEAKLEYQKYAAQLQHQIESLVDQINRMTDEREAAFGKLDNLDQLLAKANKQNDLLVADLNDIKLKYESAKIELNNLSNQSKSQNENDSHPGKEQLLENEIKYFKQQIEILVEDHNGLIKLIEDKETELNELNKQLQCCEQDRAEHGRLVEQAHNDKQALSRAVQQNREIKQQLVELQDAYVNVTQVNLDLTTQLQAAEYKLNQQAVVAETPAVAVESEQNEWGDEDADKVESTASKNDQPTLMESVKQRIEDLEKENQDLNDYINLVNKNLQKQEEALVKTEVSNHSIEQEEIIDRQLKKISFLNERIESLENEQKSLIDQLNDAKSNHVRSAEVEIKPSEQLNSFQMLEEKFNKVMKQNADLKDKNQELEHVILQLQCETETIVDYITMYQLERKKLNQKYKEKDESIRSLSTQLQVNKLALYEISNYLNTFLNIDSQTVEASGEASAEYSVQKKQFLLAQIEKILGQLTQSSSTTLNTIAASLVESNRHLISSQTPGLNSTLAPDRKTNDKLDLAKSAAAFRSELILCSTCYGELFIV